MNNSLSILQFLSLSSRNNACGACRACSANYPFTTLGDVFSIASGKGWDKKKEKRKEKKIIISKFQTTGCNVRVYIIMNVEERVKVEKGGEGGEICTCIRIREPGGSDF